MWSTKRVKSSKSFRPQFSCLGIPKRIIACARILFLEERNETIRFHPTYRKPIVTRIEIERREKRREAFCDVASSITPYERRFPGPVLRIQGVVRGVKGVAGHVSTFTFARGSNPLRPKSRPCDARACGETMHRSARTLTRIAVGALHRRTPSARNPSSFRRFLTIATARIRLRANVHGTCPSSAYVKPESHSRKYSAV